MGAIPLLRTSERMDFRRCPWKWEQVWVKGLTTRRTPTWSWFGTAIHRGLEVWYKPGLKRSSKHDLIDAFEEALHGEVRRIYTEGGEVDDTEVVDGLELGKAMLKGYVKHWGKDSDWEVIHGEQSFQIDVPRLDGDGVVCVYAGTWDLLVWDRSKREYHLVDHKTRKTFPGSWNFYNLNDQAGSYLWVAPEVLKHLGIFGKHDVIEGLTFNCLKKKMPDDRPRNSAGEYLNMNGTVSKRQPTPLFHREQTDRLASERVKQARRVMDEAWIMDGMREGRIPIFKNPTEDCDRCQLFEYCEADEQSYEDGQELAQHLLRVRDPYVSHRLAMQRHGIILESKRSKKKRKV